MATLDDYAAVRELVADLVAEGVDATVKPEIREVVEAIARLLGEGRDEVRQADLKEVLKLDKSAISGSPARWMERFSRRIAIASSIGRRAIYAGGNFNAAHSK